MDKDILSRAQRWLTDVRGAAQFPDADETVFARYIVGLAAAPLPGEVEKALDWLRVSAEFLRQGKGPTGTHAQITFAAGLREAIEVFIRLTRERDEAVAQLQAMTLDRDNAATGEQRALAREEALRDHLGGAREIVVMVKRTAREPGFVPAVLEWLRRADELRALATVER